MRTGGGRHAAITHLMVIGRSFSSTHTAKDFWNPLTNGRCMNKEQFEGQWERGKGKNQGKMGQIDR